MEDFPSSVRDKSRETLNHHGIFALVVAEYHALTGDRQFNDLAVELMKRIPRSGVGRTVSIRGESWGP